MLNFLLQLEQSKLIWIFFLIVKMIYAKKKKFIFFLLILCDIICNIRWTYCCIIKFCLKTWCILVNYFLKCIDAILICKISFFSDRKIIRNIFFLLILIEKSATFRDILYFICWTKKMISDNLFYTRLYWNIVRCNDTKNEI